MSLSLFNDVVQAMVGRSSYQLCEKYAKSESDGFIPTDITNLIGNKHAFKVVIDDYNVKNLLPVFTVLRFSNDQEIINSVLACATPMTDNEATSNTVLAITSLDLELQTDENTTPNEKQKTNKRPAEDKPGSESSTGKKKAIEIKDGDLVVIDEEKNNVALFYIKELMRSRGTTFRRWPEMPYLDERYISDLSDLGALSKKCKLIIWDEAPMTNNLCFEALDRTLRDVLCRTRLTIGASPEDVCEIRDFAEWILKVRDRELGEANDGEVSIDVPEELLIDVVDDPVTSIIDFTYPNLSNNINNPSYF
nr:hypothetical protein [Tanacetum cinerariifolium]